jgi:hypothetical protein
MMQEWRFGVQKRAQGRFFRLGDRADVDPGLRRDEVFVEKARAGSKRM